MKFDNFMFGIGGIVTFKKSTLPQVLKSVIPLERIVLETDSPYMAPVPNRGKRNESAFIKDIAAKIAEIYECALEHVMEQTTQNALKIFNRAQ
jgi:TatD DNase family protein